MSQDGEMIVGDTDQTKADQPTLDPEEEQRGTSAYGGVEQIGDFHIFVEQDGSQMAVASGMAIPFSPTIEAIYAVFADAGGDRIYTVKLGSLLAPSGNNTDSYNRTVHDLRKNGSSPWEEPWSVRALFEEHHDGWLIPTELRFGGLAEYVSLDEVIKRGIDGGPNLSKDLV